MKKNPKQKCTEKNYPVRPQILNSIIMATVILTLITNIIPYGPKFLNRK
jgi:hypothetical protein